MLEKMKQSEIFLFCVNFLLIYAKILGKFYFISIGILNLR